jgi:eukaryotic-like serine/threonine-protein kinase
MNEQSIFIAALERETHDRQAFLNEACAGNLLLRERVEKLLASNQHAIDFLDQPAGRLAPTTNQTPLARPGTQIGPYKLREQIGEGGFGVVFVAEQEKPVRRKVALKIIKPGMDTKDVIARFEAERQALALMDHPNVARVLDAGATDTGRPYFVMELVHGVPITDFCDKNKLSTRDRLLLFADVCRAVQHAHQKGIIHRDLKPSNIMVTLHDGKPVAKVIDFGVSKALSQQLTEKSIYTAYGQMIGTPSYMSPEQAEMSGLGIDTRSDIYSLGVLLYELLTGSTPLDANRLRASAYAEILRIIREEEPQRPSLKISTLGKQANIIAEHRHTDATQLRHELTGELDWIVMKCLEKDRSRRYETATGLARDIDRYLHDEPVEACPPSLAYRLKKFARRNKKPVLAASFVLLALCGGMIATAWQAVRATKAEARAIAESQEKERARQEAVTNANKAIAAAVEERKAKDLAQRRLTQIEKANDILGSIFLDLDPREEEEQGKPLRAMLGERLEQAAAQLDAEAVGDPLTVARLQHTLGTSQRMLGHYANAIDLLDKARQTRLALLGPNNQETLRSTDAWAAALGFSGQHAKALEIHEQVWTAQKATLGPDHPDTLESEFKVGMGYWHTGQREKGLKMLEHVQARSQEVLGPNDKHSLLTTNFLAATYSSNGQFEQAIPLLQQTLARQQETFGPNHIGTVFTKRNLAIAYLNSGQFDKAQPLLEESLVKFKEKLGEDHPEVLNTLHAVSSTYRMTGRLNKAIPRLEELFTRQKTTLGPDDSKTLASRDMLALAYRDNGDYSRAEELFLEALALKKQKLEPDDPSITHTMASLGWNYVGQQRYAEAETTLRECLEIRAKKESDKWQYFETQRGLGAALLGQKRYAEAEPWLVQSYQGLKEREASISTANKYCLSQGLEQIIQLYDEWGKPDEAAKWRREAASQMTPGPNK